MRSRCGGRCSRIPFGGGEVKVRGEVEKQHTVPVHEFNRDHVCLDLAEEDGDRFGVSSVVVDSDGAIKSCFSHRGEKHVSDGDGILGRFCRVLGGIEGPCDKIINQEIRRLARGLPLWGSFLEALGDEFAVVGVRDVTVSCVDARYAVVVVVVVVVVFLILFTFEWWAAKATFLPFFFSVGPLWF